MYLCVCLGGSFVFRDYFLIFAYLINKEIGVRIDP